MFCGFSSYSLESAILRIICVEKLYAFTSCDLLESQSFRTKALVSISTVI